MSGTWVLGILVPSVLLSLWCLMWCCFGAARQPPGSPARGGRLSQKRTFKYNALKNQSPRASPTTTPASPESPAVIVTQPPRTLPGLHFIHSTSINA